MEARSVVLVALLSLGLAACGGAKATGGDAKSEADMWSGYKGTYATSAAPKVGESNASPSTEKKSGAKAKAAEPQDAAEAEAEAALAASSRKSSRGMINGESVSTINASSLANASKTALKGKVLSSNAMVGSQYEQLNVSLKGVNVQIVRPAGNPSSTGPSIASPKSRNDAASKADAAFYDEEADVVVIVNAGGNKKAAQKALGSLVSR